jgi:multiple sugar transport system substrate-binding protein
MVRDLKSSLVGNGLIAHRGALASRFVVVFLASLAGCPSSQQAGTDAKKEAAAPRASVTLRVLVVNEPGVAEAINRLRGEWAERSGGEVSATASEWKDVAGAKSLEADVVVFPSRYLGELSTRGWLQPVRSSVLDGDEFKGGDVFPLIRRELMRWGGEVMALPLGIQMTVPAEANHRHPGLGFLAVAAPSVVLNEREGVLFDPQTMKPRINDPAFVVALQQFAEAGKGTSVIEKNSKAIVPVFGYADRLVAVSSSSRNGASAFKFIAWLASADMSKQLGAGEERLLPVRRSLAETTARNDAAQSADKPSEAATPFDAALNADQCLLVPRIPGIDEYMAALDEAVAKPPVDKAAAEATLQKVADRWEQITNAHGRDAQRSAYLKHLQISEK